MILIGRNAQTIEGVTIFPDHDETKNQYWYLSGPVRLARRDNQSVFTLIKYNKKSKEDKAGGYVTFEVNVGLSEETERKILSQLPEGAKLAAVPFDKGMVKCLYLDKKLGDSSPTLYSDNTAIFSLSLDEVETAILEQAFKEAGQPIGVIYDLEFTSMGPSLDVELKADLSRIYTEFQASLGFEGVIPVSPPFMLDASVEAGFQRLVQKGLIEMKVFTFVDDEDVKKQKDEALRLFMDILLKDWFEPTLELPKITDKEDQDDLALNETTEGEKEKGEDKPKEEGKEGEETTPEGSTGDDIKDVADGLEEFMPQFKVKLRFVHQEEFKKITYRFTGSQTTTKKYYPQGFFGRLLSDVNQDKGIVTVDVDDPFFRTIKIDVQAPQVGYEKYGLQSIHFAAKYPDREIASRIFDKEHLQADPVEFAVNKALDTSYSYQVQYNFLPDTGWEGEKFSYELPWQPTEDRAQVLIPHEYISFLDINATLERNFYWDKIQEVRVQLKYQSPDGKWSREKVLAFNPDSETEQHWKVRLNSLTTNPEYTYSFLYQLDDGSTKTSEWVTSRVPGIAVPDLTRGKLSVELVPLLDSAIDKRVYVDLSYADAANDYTWEKSVTLASNATQPVELQIPLMDLSKPEFQYTLTFLRPNNETYKKPFPLAKYKRIMVESIGMGELAVEVTPEEIDWDAVRLVTVDLLYQDSQNNIQENATQTFRKYDQPFNWKVAIADKSLTGYKWRATFYMRDSSLGNDGEIYYPAAKETWETASAKFLFLDKYQPKEEKLEIEVSAQDIDWEQVKEVEVNLRYSDEREEVNLNEDNDTFLWQVKPENGNKEYKWKAVFHMAKGKSKSTKWKTDVDDMIELDGVLQTLL